MCSNLQLKNIWRDMMSVSVDLHTKLLKEETISDIPKYLLQYDLASVLVRLKNSGKKLFLLTNRFT